jgi:ketosteroid isomerase-like protein
LTGREKMKMSVGRRTCFFVSATLIACSWTTFAPSEEGEGQDAAEAVKAVADKATLARKTVDEKSVRERAHEFIAAFSIDDPSKTGILDDILAEDFTQVGSDGRLYEGKAENLRLYAKSMEDIREGFDSLRIDYDIRSVRVFGEGATVFGKLEMEGMLKGEETPFRRGVWETLVFQKDTDGWRLVHEHSTVAAPADRRPAAEGISRQ